MLAGVFDHKNHDLIIFTMLCEKTQKTFLTLKFFVLTLKFFELFCDDFLQSDCLQLLAVHVFHYFFVQSIRLVQVAEYE